MTLRFCTVTKNTAPNGNGGGMQNQNGDPLTISHSIVTGNIGGDTSGTVTNAGFNIISGNAGLDTGLKDNGGPTQTIALLHGSPAIDAGDPNVATPPAFDQRGSGFPRIVGQRVDLGAFERQIVNNAPEASGQTITTFENTAKVVTLAASDADGNPLTYSIVSGPAHGSLGNLSGNQVTYTPAASYRGPDSFTFKANDGAADSNVATVEHHRQRNRLSGCHHNG